ncbi:MAG: LamB/YcsF family protein, partial [Dinghuibacter sp.]|nr:LamB/YcsF family protein [Dinghuibacter sp.]
NETLAQTLLLALAPYKQKTILYGLSGSLFNRLAQRAGFAIAHEVFADRTYQTGGILTPRSEPGAVIEEEDTAVYQVLQMILEKRVRTITGEYTPVLADTVCIHGDTRHAAQFARRLQAMVNDNFITLQAPTLKHRVYE